MYLHISLITRAYVSNPVDVLISTKYVQFNQKKKSKLDFLEKNVTEEHLRKMTTDGRPSDCACKRLGRKHQDWPVCEDHGICRQVISDPGDNFMTRKWGCSSPAIYDGYKYSYIFHAFRCCCQLLDSRGKSFNKCTPYLPFNYIELSSILLYKLWRFFTIFMYLICNYPMF
jgi:hypothetical protein